MPATFRASTAARAGRPLFILSSTLPNILKLARLPLQAYALPTTGSGGLHAWEEDNEPEVRPGTAAYYLKLVVVLCLVLIGGMLAGLTLALMSQDSVNLTVMEASGDDKERKRAKKVLSLLKKGQHWVLVTLLLYNTITNETLPIFLDSILGGGVSAVISSTALILLFGEIIPQAICSRYGLAIGAASVPIMTVLMYASYPLSYPIALLLDKVLGHDEGVTYKKKELKTFVSLHRHLGAETLMDDEVTIISAVLELSEKSIEDIMVPIDDIYSLSTEQILNEETVAEILRQGYSRVPVYEKSNKSNFIGMLLVKNLVIYDPEDCKPVSSFQLIPLPEAEPGMSCLEALNFFQQGRSHMMLVTKAPGEPEGALGIVSLEDVIEELIGEEIIDETDLFLDVANKIKVVRRPQIRTGAAKKLTPLLKDAAVKRMNKVNGSGKISRTNSESESESARPPSFTGLAPRDYGAIVAGSGVSTPRRRPSGPHRLGTVNSTTLAFDKVKIKGGSLTKRKETLEAVRQNLAAIGNSVVEVAVADTEGGGSEAGYEGESNGSRPNGSRRPSSAGSTGSDTAITIRLANTDDSGEERRTSYNTLSRNIQNGEDADENAPLLGGKVVGSPSGDA